MRRARSPSLSLDCAERRFPVGRRGCIRRRSGSSARSAISSASTPKARRIARPWLDHGRWDVRHPLGDAARGRSGARRYAFLPAEGESLHQIPVGPVHAGIIEPGHFRFTANGETVVRLEERLGYVHKGIERLMAGRRLDARRAARRPRLRRQHRRLCPRLRARGRGGARHRGAAARALAARADGRARAARQSFRRHRRDLQRRGLRADARPLRACCASACCAPPMPRFGHRLMMDRVVPGGVAADLDAAGVAAHRALCSTRSARRFPALVALYDNTASLQDRTVGTGMLRAGAGAAVRRRRLCRPRLGPRLRRAPRLPAIRPTTQLDFEVPVRDGRRRQCARLDPHPRGRAEPRADRRRFSTACRRARSAPSCRARGASGEGMALVEGFRGDILVWLRLGARRHGRALPSARSVLVPVAAAGSGDRRQHRRRLPALQQILQLLLFRPRSLRRAMRKHLFEGLDPQAADRAGARSPTMPRSPSSPRRSTARRGGASAAACRSARSMPARAMAASSRSTRSTTPSTISSASACASSPRRAMPTCCWSPGR